MMRSLFAAVSGLQAHQQMMDVIGDNIANVNTAGFKASRVLFEDTLSQLVSGGSAPNAVHGGTNPEQIGLGVRVGAVEMADTQGALQSTGRPTDVAIEGAGYFPVRSGTQTLYTRAGAFGFDSGGNLTDSSGMIVQGWLADPKTGLVSTTGPLSDLHLPLGQAIPPKATSTVQVGGNLSADAATGTDVQTSISVVDSLGAQQTIKVDMVKSATTNTWQLTVTDPQGTQTGPLLVFDPSTGQLASPTTLPSFKLAPTTGATASTYTVNFGAPGTPNALSQFGGTSTAIALSQDGTQSGFLRSFAIGSDGTVSGVFSNGQSKQLGQIALATFNNPAGLTKSGEGHFQSSVSSGGGLVGIPGAGAAGSLAAGSLEMSNVDLAQEFTNLIIAQRGFQANSKVISTSDQMLQDLVNLKQ